MARDYGSGQLTPVGAGRWRLRVSAGTDLVTGKRRVITETVHGTKKSAQQRLAELVAEQGRRGASSEVSLARIIDAWLEQGGHARGTHANYTRARSRIPATMLATPARRIGPHDLQRLYTAVTKQHGPHPTHYLHALISGAYTNARRLRWVHDHPARDAALPALTKRPKTTPTVEQARAILAAAPDQQQALWLRLVAVTGRRRAEPLALRWSDLDLAAGVVHVQHALDVDRTVKTTKTSDQADIALDPRTVAAVRSWQTAQRARALAVGIPLDPDPWLLSDEPDSSRPWRPDTATKRFAAIRTAAGVPDRIRLTDMRHANVTRLIASGIDPRTVAGRVGHDPATSLGIYAGMDGAANRHAADVIAAVLDG